MALLEEWQILMYERRQKDMLEATRREVHFCLILLGNECVAGLTTVEQ